MKLVLTLSHRTYVDPQIVRHCIKNFNHGLMTVNDINHQNEITTGFINDDINIWTKYEKQIIHISKRLICLTMESKNDYILTDPFVILKMKRYLYNNMKTRIIMKIENIPI